MIHVKGTIYVLNFNLIECMVWQPELLHFLNLNFFLIFFFLNKAHLAVPGRGEGIVVAVET